MSKLTEVAVYKRRIGASLERVWENVLDWEHLPWLHSASFASIQCLDSGSGGWRAEVEIVHGDRTLPAEIDLRVERERNRYLTATVGGSGAGSEIWTSLSPVATHQTDIEVRFRIPGVESDQADQVGALFTALYGRLWDEDEAMMQHREAMLGKLAGGSDKERRVDMGPLDEVVAKLPLVVDLGGRPYRVLSVDGAVVAHAAFCPHALGPLDEAPPDGRTIRCPWHGYEFDLRSGRSCDGRKLRLAANPNVFVEKGRVVLALTDL